jgi:hypothetical protein
LLVRTPEEMTDAVRRQLSHQVWVGVAGRFGLRYDRVESE